MSFNLRETPSAATSNKDSLSSTSTPVESTILNVKPDTPSSSSVALKVATTGPTSFDPTEAPTIASITGASLFGVTVAVTSKLTFCPALSDAVIEKLLTPESAFKGVPTKLSPASLRLTQAGADSLNVSVSSSPTASS